MHSCHAGAEFSAPWASSPIWATPECNRDLAPRLIARGLFLVSRVSVLGFWEQPQHRCAEIGSYSLSDTFRTLSKCQYADLHPFTPGRPLAPRLVRRRGVIAA